MFKNKTEQNRNDERYNQTGLAVKSHTKHGGIRATAIMLRSVAASSSWRSPSSQWSKPQKLHRPPFEWKNKNLLWYPFRCVERKTTSVTAAEFYGAVIPSDLHVPVSSVEKVCFRLVMWKNLHVSSATLRLKFTEHFTFRFCIREKGKTFQQKCQIRPSEPFKFVNYRGMWTLMVWHFWQL